MMDQAMLEKMRFAAATASLQLAFKYTLERLARQSDDPQQTIKSIEDSLVAANRNADSTPNMPSDVYLSLVEIGVKAIEDACSDVRRTVGRF